MNPLEYSFGTGSDAPTAWMSAADFDLGEPGAADAVRLDFDGDGFLDDAMWDSDGDGVVDHSVLDVGGEDCRYFTDPSGAGTWNVEVAGPGLAPESSHSPPPSQGEVPERSDTQRPQAPRPGLRTVGFEAAREAVVVAPVLPGRANGQSVPSAS